MGPEKIANEETLAAWMKSLPRGTAAEIADTRRKAVWIAHRAAVRLLKYALRTKAGLDSANREKQALVVLRASLLSDAAARDPDPEIIAAASRCPLPIDPGTQVGADAILLEAPKIATSLALSAAASSGPDFLNSAISATNHAAQILTYIAEEDAVGTGTFVDREADFWEIVNWERGLLEKNRDFEKEKLWGPANLFDEEWLRDGGLLSPVEAFGPFWSRWHEGILTGDQIDVGMLKEIALLPTADWAKGTEHVNALIAELQLKHAVTRTPNAEVISVNEASGRLRVDPISDMPRDVLAEAVQRLQDVIAVMRPRSRQSDQHRALETEVQILADASGRYAHRPRMLHSACVRVLRRLDVKIRNGECPGPEQDADVADFHGTVLAVTLDLFERDFHVRDAVSGAANARLREPDTDQAAIIVRAADEVAAAAEDDLAAELPVDARIAIDLTVPEAERKEALYRICSRMLRVWLIAGYQGTKATLREIEEVTRTAAGMSKNVAVLSASCVAALNSPLWLPAAIRAILGLF